MPSPLGHALAGAAAGWVVSSLRRDAHWCSQRTVWRTGLLFAFLGTLPDTDLLFGAHSGPTHGLGSALIIGLAAAAVTRDGLLSVGASAAYASHTLLDWLGSDSSAPIGIMALWPFSREYFESDLHLFHAISRRYWLPGFFGQNLRAVLRELMILLPVLGVALWLLQQGQREKGSET